MNITQFTWKVFGLTYKRNGQAHMHNDHVVFY